MSGQLLNYIQQARRSPILLEQYGRALTETEFFRVAILEWILEKAPYILIDDLEGNVPEYLEIDSIKKKHEASLKETKDFAKDYFKKRKTGQIKFEKETDQKEINRINKLFNKK